MRDKITRNAARLHLSQKHEDSTDFAIEVFIELCLTLDDAAETIANAIRDNKTSLESIANKLDYLEKAVHGIDIG